MILMISDNLSQCQFITDFERQLRNIFSMKNHVPVNSYFQTGECFHEASHVTSTPILLRWSSAVFSEDFSVSSMQ